MRLLDKSVTYFCGEYRIIVRLAKYFTFNISSHVFPMTAKTRCLTLSFRGSTGPRSRTGGPATRATGIETAAAM
jgi:hypothetical protein